MRILLACALLAGCQEQKVGVYNTPPSVSILTPADGERFSPESLVEFYGIVSDSQDDPESLLVSWSSSLDGELCADPPDAEGTVYCAYSGLSSGSHAITLTGADLDGESDSASVAIEVSYDDDGGGNEGAPTVVLTGPAEGASYLQGETVTFVGAITDGEQSWDTLTARLISDLDGTIWEGNPDSGGTVSVSYTSLSAGSHTITLQGEDDDGNTGSDTVSISITEDGRPSATITAPGSGEEFSTEETVVLEGMVSDGEDDTEVLTVVWSSSLSGVLSTGAPDSSGYTAAPVALIEGTHVITLAVYDTDGKEGTDSVTLTVLDGDNVDDDGDTYTENEGDCDDYDSSIHPGAEEDCDEVDNDCDGSVNEDFADAYESNESASGAYDLGEVDSSLLWEGSSAAISGLTLHTETDVDCFRWDADDDYYDDVDIYITIGTFSSSGAYAATLYMNDGGWTSKDSASGTSRLILEWDGDLLDDDEDEWAICVWSTSWHPSVCEGGSPYTIDISS